MAQADQTEALRTKMRRCYDLLIEFVTSPSFEHVVEELYNLPQEQRPQFVAEVILDPVKLAARGVRVPDGVLLQRSTFGDGRRTLFVAKAYLPDDSRQVWENVNITFDQEPAGEFRGAPDEAWRRPLPVPVQAALQAMGIEGA